MLNAEKWIPKQGKSNPDFLTQHRWCDIFVELLKKKYLGFGRNDDNKENAGSPKRLRKNFYR